MLHRTTGDPVASTGKYTRKFHQDEIEANAPQPADRPPALPAEAPPLDLIHDMLLDHDDETFSANLITYITTDDLGPHTAPLHDARVMARLCALHDTLFIRTLLALAGPDHAGLALLYETPIMARAATLAYAHYHGVLVPGLSAVLGREVPHYLRELRPYVLRQRWQTAGDAEFAPLTATALLAKEIPDLEFIVEDILPVGATLFVGRAKDGKSLAMWNLCLAVASGGVVFGRYPTTAGPVLYLALEDGERRAKQRLQDQMRAMDMDTCPEGFEVLCWEAPRVGEGLEERLHVWLDTHPGAKLIVIDILEKVRPPRTRNGSIYADDYAAVAPLQRLAQDRGIALVIVHHTHKAKADDFRDTPSGSISLLGAVDTLWSLRRVAGERDAVLQITGRDLLETPELAMQFQDGFWTARGDAATTVLNPAHQAILHTLRTTGYAMTPTQLATVLGVNLNTMKVHLMRLTERGLVWKDGQGHYAPRVTPLEQTEGVTRCNPVTLPPGPGTAPYEPRTPSARDTLPEETTSASLADVRKEDPSGDATRVTPVTPVTPHASPDTAAPPAPRTPPTHGHRNGHHGNGTPPCPHAWEVQGSTSYCPKCQVRHPIKRREETP